MKLLFDENLSPKLGPLLGDLFPDSVHVRDVALKAADDPIVWKYAADNGLMICSKDSDMHQRSFVFGYPLFAEPCRISPFVAALTAALRP
jgi:predicted nuclease of predicted toxin-antitoxin system